MCDWRACEETSLGEGQHITARCVGLTRSHRLAPSVWHILHKEVSSSTHKSKPDNSKNR